MASKKGSVFQAIKEYFVFRPGAPGYANYPRKPGATSGGYRTPSPGSQSPAYIPSREADKDLFNTQYYTRNTRKNLAPAPLPALRTENFAAKQTRMIEGGSPGRKNPAVERYDPTMTRSAMTTSWAAMRAEVEKLRPTHFPHPWWASERNKAAVDDVKARAKKNGHREPFGVPKKSLGVPRYENVW